jgi:hypothetical protein
VRLVGHMRTLTRTSIALLLFLSAVALSQKGTDGYEFGEPQYFKEYVYIKIVRYDTQAELAIASSDHGFEMWQAVRAFAVMSKDPLGVCEIHIVDPVQIYTPEYYGHEVLHCFYGNWHRQAIEE